MELKQQTQGFSLKDKTAAVIGLGGLGCNVAIHLAGACFEKIYLCDFDTVSESNLNRQFFYNKDDIGKNKAERATAFLSAYAPETDFICINKKITSTEDLIFAKDCDIVFSALDNSSTRLLLEDFASEMKLPLVCGGIDGFYGMAYLYIPEKGNPPSQLGMSENGKAEYSVSATAGVIGSLQASLGIQYLLTKDNTLSKKLFIFDEAEIQTLHLK